MVVEVETQPGRVWIGTAGEVAALTLLEFGTRPVSGRVNVHVSNERQEKDKRSIGKRQERKR